MGQERSTATPMGDIEWIEIEKKSLEFGKAHAAHEYHMSHMSHECTEVTPTS